jgi:hypothetical protein
MVLYVLIFRIVCVTWEDKRLMRLRTWKYCCCKSRDHSVLDSVVHSELIIVFTYVRPCGWDVSACVLQHMIRIQEFPLECWVKWGESSPVQGITLLIQREYFTRSTRIMHPASYGIRPANSTYCSIILLFSFSSGGNYRGSKSQNYGGQQEVESCCWETARSLQTRRITHLNRAAKNLATQGRAIAQAVCRRLPTAAVRVQARVKSCGICGEQSDTEVGFLRVLRYSLLILIPPTAPDSSSIIGGWYNKSVSGRCTKCTQFHPTSRNQN